MPIHRHRMYYRERRLRGGHIVQEKEVIDPMWKPLPMATLSKEEGNGLESEPINAVKKPPGRHGMAILKQKAPATQGEIMDEIQKAMGNWNMGSKQKVRGGMVKFV
jgi:hypothetical protein